MFQGRKIFDILRFAAVLSLKEEDKYNSRKAVIGAVGFGKDGRIVSAHNAGAGNDAKHPPSHAESRLCRKLGRGADEVYLARIRRDTFELAMSRPCPICMIKLKSKGVKRVIYSISNTEYGVINFDYCKSIKMRERTKK